MTILGLLQIRYDRQKQKFVKTRLLILYSTCFSFAILYLYPSNCIELLTTFNPLIAIAFGYLTIGTVSVIFLVQTVKQNQIIHFFNECLQVSQELVFIVGTQSKTNMLRMVLGLLCAKIIGNCAMMGSLIKLQILVFGSINSFTLVLIFIVNTIISIIGNMFYGCCMTFVIYYDQINSIIDDIVTQARNTNQNGQVNVTRFYAVRQCCDLSDRIDRLAIQRTKLFELSRSLNGLCEIQLFTSITTYFGILLIEVFGLYRLYIVTKYNFTILL